MGLRLEHDIAMAYGEERLRKRRRRHQGTLRSERPPRIWIACRCPGQLHRLHLPSFKHRREPQPAGRAVRLVHCHTHLAEEVEGFHLSLLVVTMPICLEGWPSQLRVA